EATTAESPGRTVTRPLGPAAGGAGLGVHRDRRWCGADAHAAAAPDARTARTLVVGLLVRTHPALPRGHLRGPGPDTDGLRRRPRRSRLVPHGHRRPCGAALQRGVRRRLGTDVGDTDRR